MTILTASLDIEIISPLPHAGLVSAIIGIQLLDISLDQSINSVTFIRTILKMGLFLYDGIKYDLPEFTSFTVKLMGLSD